MRPQSWGEGFLVMTCPPWLNTGSRNERNHGWKLGLFRSTYDILWLWWISGFSTEWEDEHGLQQTNWIHKFFPLIFLEGFKVTWSRYILFFKRFCVPYTSSLASQKTSSIFSRSELPKVQYQWGFQRLWKKADEIQNFMGLHGSENNCYMLQLTLLLKGYCNMHISYFLHITILHNM